MKISTVMSAAEYICAEKLSFSYIFKNLQQKYGGFYLPGLSIKITFRLSKSLENDPLTIQYRLPSAPEGHNKDFRYLPRRERGGGGGGEKYKNIYPANKFPPHKQKK